MFSKAKVGDRVWSLLWGWGIISKVDQQEHPYPIRVEFDIDEVEWFTLCGKYLLEHINPTLFLDEVKITPPHPKLAVDTPILVRDEDDEDWQPAHFARFTPEGVVTWVGGRTSYTNGGYGEISWEQWKLTESENNQ